jgi:hypothetical protein
LLSGLYWILSGPEALWKRISDLFDPSIGRSIRPIRR